MTNLTPLYRPACQFKGLSSEQEQRLENARFSHLEQVEALGKLDSATLTEIVDKVLTFGPDSEYGKQGGVDTLHKFVFPPHGYQRSSWSQPLTEEESQRCWQVVQLLREHPKGDKATKGLVTFFSKNLKHIKFEQYTPCSFPADVEVSYLKSLFQYDLKPSFMVDVLEHHMGLPGSQDMTNEMSRKLISYITRYNDKDTKRHRAQEILDLLQNKPSAIGIPEPLYLELETNLYPH